MRQPAEITLSDWRPLACAPAADDAGDDRLTVRLHLSLTLSLPRAAVLLWARGG